MRRAVALALVILSLAAPAAAAPLTFGWRIGRDAVALRSDPSYGGAVTSLRFRGQEYIDRADHGRELQGAIWLYKDGGVTNPTQAGSCHDTRSEGFSRLLSAEITAETYATRTDMALWLQPGYGCSGSSYRKILRAGLPMQTGTIYDQVFRPGYRGFANAVEADITFTTPIDVDSARVEAITAYMPPAFASFYLFDPAAGAAFPQAFGATNDSEQGLPVIAATADGRSAMAVLSLTADPQPRYNGFVLPEVSKWNLVFYPAGPYAAGPHAYKAVWIIGTLDEVTATLRALTK